MRRRPEPGSELDMVKRQVGKRIRAHRTALGVPCRAVSKALGISAQQLNKYEIGVDGITAGRLYRMAYLLGISVDYLLSDDPLDAPPASEHVELNGAFRQIADPAQRARALKIVKEAAAGRLKAH